MTARIVMKLDVVEREALDHEVLRVVFRHPRRPTLPAWRPGAHVDVRLPDGKIRQYSLIGDPAEAANYTVAIKREDEGRGGSQWLHEHLAVGDVAHVSAPRNNFPLEPGPAVFIAGGIGVTPMIAMAREAGTRGDVIAFHYCVARRAPPFLPLLDALGLGERLVAHVSENGPEARLDIARLVDSLPAGTHLYCCGPERLTSAVEEAAEGIMPESHVHFEVFAATLDENYKPEPFEIRVSSSGESFTVPADRSALEVLREAGHVLPSSCELGVCGSCECGYSDGTVIHRDAVLRPAARQSRMMLCVSRARVAVTVDL